MFPNAILISSYFYIVNNNSLRICFYSCKTIIIRASDRRLVKR
nr:MAG TPA: hypothetical protein [Caudoviricetes sp.]